MKEWEAKYGKTKNLIKKTCCIYTLVIYTFHREAYLERFYITLMFHEAALEQNMNVLWRGAEIDRLCSFQIKRPALEKKWVDIKMSVLKKNI